MINLTYQLHQGMFKYPSDSEAEIKIIKARLEGEKYLSGRVNMLFTNHHGTHIDAPAHKFPDGKTIDQYERGKFVNTSALIDLTSTDLLSRKKRCIELEDLMVFDFNKFPLVSGLVLYQEKIKKLLKKPFHIYLMRQLHI
jgi:kynurenine formamidase